MSVEFLERKKKAIDDVLEAYRAFKGALRELPIEWAKEVLDDLAEQEPLPDVQHRAPEQTQALLSPTEAVMELLRKHPKGLLANEIIKTLAGKIQTTSGNPTKLLYSVLTTLKRNSKIVQAEDRRYQLPPRPSAG